MTPQLLCLAPLWLNAKTWSTLAHALGITPSKQTRFNFFHCRQWRPCRGRRQLKHLFFHQLLRDYSPSCDLLFFFPPPMPTARVNRFGHPISVCKHFLPASGATKWILEAVAAAERMLDNGWDWWVFGRFPCDPAASGRNKVRQVWQPASIYQSAVIGRGHFYRDTHMLEPEISTHSVDVLQHTHCVSFQERDVVRCWNDSSSHVLLLETKDASLPASWLRTWQASEHVPLLRLLAEHVTDSTRVAANTFGGFSCGGNGPACSCFLY